MTWPEPPNPMRDVYELTGILVLTILAIWAIGSFLHYLGWWPW